MRLTNPLECLATALHHAAFVALPLRQYENVDFEAMADWTLAQRRDAIRQENAGGVGRPRVQVKRRPEADECQVHAMFPEIWGSGALGFGGMGTASMTPAYTVVIEGPGRDHAVYWHGRFAYLVPALGPTTAQRHAFAEDLAMRRTATLAEAVERYGAVLR